MRVWSVGRGVGVGGMGIVRGVRMDGTIAVMYVSRVTARANNAPPILAIAPPAIPGTTYLTLPVSLAMATASPAPLPPLAPLVPTPLPSLLLTLASRVWPTVGYVMG